MRYRDRYVFYKDRPDWSDVQPVPQDEGERNVVRIAYSPQFTDAHDYMRAVLLKDERSERALEITGTVLLLNPANYTVWEYRRRILISLQADLLEELALTSDLIDDHAKNYQLWYHREWISTKLSEKYHSEESDPESHEKNNNWLSAFSQGELSFVASIIADDSKNYHAWQYRRWVVSHFKVPPKDELFYTDTLIQADVYNNSVWNHRFVTVTKDEGLTPPVLKREVEYVQKMIRKAPNNESSWNYLYGLLVPSPCIAVSYNAPHPQPNKTSLRPDLVGFNTSTDVVDETSQSTAKSLRQLVTRPASAANLRAMRTFAEELADSDTVACNSVPLLGFLVDVYADCIQTRVDASTKETNVTDVASLKSVAVPVGDDPSPGDGSEEPLSNLIDLAVSACERLATELDRIRANYWRYRSRQVQAMVNSQ